LSWKVKWSRLYPRSHLVWWRLRERPPAQQYQSLWGQQQRSTRQPVVCLVASLVCQQVSLRYRAVLALPQFSSSSSSSLLVCLPGSCLAGFGASVQHSRCQAYWPVRLVHCCSAAVTEVGEDWRRWSWRVEQQQQRRRRFRHGWLIPCSSAYVPQAVWRTSGRMVVSSSFGVAYCPPSALLCQRGGDCNCVSYSRDSESHTTLCST
jgi:hypothetical protein